MNEPGDDPAGVCTFCDSTWDCDGVKILFNFALPCSNEIDFSCFLCFHVVLFSCYWRSNSWYQTMCSGKCEFRRLQRKPFMGQCLLYQNNMCEACPAGSTNEMSKRDTLCLLLSFFVFLWMDLIGRRRSNWSESSSTMSRRLHNKVDVCLVCHVILFVVPRIYSWECQYMNEPSYILTHGSVAFSALYSNFLEPFVRM